MKNRIVFGPTCIFFLVFLTACSSAESGSTTQSDRDLSGVVEEVRVLAVAVQQNKGDDAIGGAIVGHMIAGKTGATVGAIVGAADSGTITATRITACQFRVSVDGKVLYYLDYFAARERCALLRKGDTVAIHYYEQKYWWNSNRLATSL